MKTAPCGTVIGYDVATGKELFRETNRVILFTDGTRALPYRDLFYVVNEKTYRVVGVHTASTEAMCAVDVHEESA